MTSLGKDKLAKSSKKRPKIGIALGGGGPMGGVYQIGALRAIDEVLEGLNLNELDHYIGVNAGSFIAANLANQITPAQMCRIFVRHEADIHPFHPDVFYRPALKEYSKRIFAAPRLFMSALQALLKNPSDQSVLEYLTVMAQTVPAGVFDNEGFHTYVKRAFSSLGRTNDFTLLRRSLLIIAADLETGETVRFGSEGKSHIPISKAIQASMAAPGLYVPVEFDGRYYMDGTLNKGLHCSVAFEEGCDMVLAVNPVVPVDVFSDVGSKQELRRNLVESGMGNVLSQSYRTMVNSRLHSGLKNLKREHPKGKMFLFEPSRSQAKMFLSSVFSFNARKRVCEQAYQTTRSRLREYADELESVLSPLGVNVRRDVLDDPNRTLTAGLYGETIPMYEQPKPIQSAQNDEESQGYLKRLASWL